MNAREDARRTTVAITSGLAVAALATTVTVGLVVARSDAADAATSGTTDSGDTSSSTTTQSNQSDQSSSGSSGSTGVSPGSGSADATSGGS